MIFRQLAKDSVVYGGADLVTKVISFFAFPILAAALSPRAFGVLELLFTLTAVLGVVLTCGLNNSVQRFYWDKDTEAIMQPAIVTSGLYVMATFGILMIFAGSISISFFSLLSAGEDWPLTWVALFAALLVTMFSALSQYTLDVVRLHGAPWRFFGLAVAFRVFTVGLGLVAVVYFGLGIDGLLVAQALVLILVLPLALWVIRRDHSPSRFDYKWSKTLIRFGYPYIYAGLAYCLLGSMDRWMLASMSTLEEVGIYSVAFRFASVVLFVSAAFGQAWSPIAVKIRTNHPERYREIFGHVLLVLIFVMLTVGGGVALFAGELISLMMPKEYATSALPMVILCFAIVIQSTQQVTAIGISFEKKTYLFARIAGFVVIVNFVGNWFLIPKYGAAGASWATLISYIVITCSYLFYTQHFHPLVIQWARLATLLLLGLLVAFIAINTVSVTFELTVALSKFVFALVCFFLGLRFLPMRSFKEI